MSIKPLKLSSILCQSSKSSKENKLTGCLSVGILLSITIGAGENFLKTGDYPLLTIWSAGHALNVFVNGQLAGNIRENNGSFSSLVLC